MPRSKNIGSYPEAFQELVRQAATRPVEVPCGTEAEARKLMGRLYAFHGALKRAGEIKVGKESFQVQANNELATLAKMAEKVQYRVVGEILLARPQDMDPAAMLIEKALGGQTSRPITSCSIIPSAGFLAGLTNPDGE